MRRIPLIAMSFHRRRNVFTQEEGFVKIQAIILSATLVVPMAMMGQSMNHTATTANKSSNGTSQLSSSDQHFLSQLGKEDQSEIDMAKLAIKKSSNPQVRQYAQNKILAADPSMEEQAKQIAERDKAPISATPNSWEKQEYDRLSKLSGKQFDQAYMKYEAHKQGRDLADVQHEISSTNNHQVKTYAQNEETPVKQAAQSAQQVDSSLGK